MKRSAFDNHAETHHASQVNPSGVWAGRLRDLWELVGEVAAWIVVALIVWGLVVLSSCAGLQTAQLEHREEVSVEQAQEVIEKLATVEPGSQEERELLMQLEAIKDHLVEVQKARPTALAADTASALSGWKAELAELAAIFAVGGVAYWRRSRTRRKEMDDLWLTLDAVRKQGPP